MWTSHERYLRSERLEKRFCRGGNVAGRSGRLFLGIVERAGRGDGGDGGACSNLSSPASRAGVMNVVCRRILLDAAVDTREDAMVGYA